MDGRGRVGGKVGTQGRKEGEDTGGSGVKRDGRVKVENLNKESRER